MHKKERTWNNDMQGFSFTEVEIPGYYFGVKLPKYKSGVSMIWY